MVCSKRDASGCGASLCPRGTEGRARQPSQSGRPSTDAGASAEEDDSAGRKGKEACAPTCQVGVDSVAGKLEFGHFLCVYSYTVIGNSDYVTQIGASVISPSGTAF